MDWNNPQEVKSLDAQTLLESIGSSYALLDNPIVLEAFETHLEDPSFLEGVNQKWSLLNAWGQKKGIAFSENSGITSFTRGVISTRGKSSTTFNPEDVPFGSTVQIDGSLLLPQDVLVKGLVSKEDDYLILRGGSLTEDDQEIKVFGKSSIKVKDKEYIVEGVIKNGPLTIFSKDRFYLEFNKKNNLVINSLNKVKIKSRGQEIATLHYGKATVFSNGKIRFSEFEKTEDQPYLTLPNLFKVEKIDPNDRKEGEFQIPTEFSFSDSDVDKAIFTVRKETDYCYEILDCAKSSFSSIEVIKDIGKPKKPSERLGVDILKITAKDSSRIKADLIEPRFDSLFVDAKDDNEVRIRQAIGEETSETLISNGKIGYQFGDKPVGNTVFSVSNDASFDSEGELVAGKIYVLRPKEVSAPLTTLDKFNIHDFEKKGEALLYVILSMGEVSCNPTYEDCDVKKAELSEEDAVMDYDEVTASVELWDFDRFDAFFEKVCYEALGDLKGKCSTLLSPGSGYSLEGQKEFEEKLLSLLELARDNPDQRVAAFEEIVSLLEPDEEAYGPENVDGQYRFSTKIRNMFLASLSDDPHFASLLEESKIKDFRRAEKGGNIEEISRYAYLINNKELEDQYLERIIKSYLDDPKDLDDKLEGYYQSYGYLRNYCSKYGLNNDQCPYLNEIGGRLDALKEEVDQRDLELEE